MIYDERGAPRFPGGQPLWHGLKGEALTDEQASRLLGDIDRRRVARTLIRDRRERIEISTIFTPDDMGFLSDRRPVLWETMIFGGSEDGIQIRYTSRDAAKSGHRDTVRFLKLAIAVEAAGRAHRRRMHAAYRRKAKSWA